jgi:outer membrane receptor protein involved in Fe transport
VNIISNSAVANIVQFLPSAVFLDNKIDQTGLELRLASKAPDVSKLPLTWVAGVYAGQTKTDVTDTEPIFGINQAFTSAGVSIDDPAQWDPNSGGFFPNAFPNDNSYFSNRHYKDRQNSIFGELTWYASERLRLIAGLRYLRASENFRREGGDYFAGVPYTTTAISTSASRATPRFAVNYDWDTQTTLYASAAEGFRLGGANRPIPLTIQGVSANLAALGLSSAPDAFRPDSLWSYEIGSKSRFLDNRVSLNLAAFYVDWRNIQQDIYLPSAGFDFETNVGKATSSGFEFELRARVTDDLTLSASGGLVRAVFAEDVPSLGTDSAGNLHVRKGDPIQGVPRYNLRAGGEYHFHLAEHDSVLRLNVQGTGSSHGSVVPGDQDYYRPSYVTADASWGVSLGGWELALIAKNLGNDHTVLQHPIIQSVNQAYYLRPQTYGLSLSGAL